MLHKAWSSIEEVPYCFWRSSVKFHHTAKKNRWFWPRYIWDNENIGLGKCIGWPCSDFDPLALIKIKKNVCLHNKVRTIHPITTKLDNFFCCDQAALRTLLSVHPSVCLSVRLLHFFHNVPVIVSSWNFQELLPMTEVMSMQKVKGQGHRSEPNLAVSGCNSSLNLYMMMKWCTKLNVA